VQVLGILSELLPARKALFELIVVGHDHHSSTGHVDSGPALSVMPVIASAVDDLMRRVITPPSALPMPTSPWSDVEQALEHLTHLPVATTGLEAQQHGSEATCRDGLHPQALRQRSVDRVVFRLFIVRMQTTYVTTLPTLL